VNPFERKTRVGELYLQGMRQNEIAETLGVSTGCVSNDMDGLRTWWKERASADRLERLGAALARLDEAERLCWASGNLKLILKCLDMQLRVLGAYTPSKVVLPVAVLNWDQLAEVPDRIEERLNREEERLNGQGA
jgi:hypothetical protein